MMGGQDEAGPRTYCTLFLAFNGDLQEGKATLGNVECVFESYVDNQSAERLTRTKRLAALDSRFAVGAAQNRHHWSLSSNGKIRSHEFEAHCLWLFAQFPSEVDFAALGHQGFQTKLSCFWESNSFGGGPIITPRISRLIGAFEIPLDIDIYPAG